MPSVVLLLRWNQCEQGMNNAKVTITEDGRSGSVSYTEPGGTISGWWEFAGGDAIAIVNMGSESVWCVQHPWAMDRRADILRSVGDEVVRQKASGCKAEIDLEGGWINIVR